MYLSKKLVQVKLLNSKCWCINTKKQITNSATFQVLFVEILT